MTSCTGFILVDISKNIFTCEGSSITSCSYLYPYLYKKSGETDKKYCLKSCKDTEDSEFLVFTYLKEIKKIVEEEETITMECLDESKRSSFDGAYYIDKISLIFLI